MADDRAGTGSLEQIAEHLPGAIWDLGLASQSFSNPGAHEVSATSLRALPGIELELEDAATGQPSILLHPEDRARLVEDLRRSAHGSGEVRCALRARDLSGAWRWLRLLAAPTSADGDTRRWTAFVYEAGAEVEREQQLCAERDAALSAEQRIRELVDGMSGIVFEVRREADGRLTYPYISAGLRGMTGLDPEECRKDPALMSSRIVAEDIDVVLDAVNSDEMGSLILNYRFRAPDGSLRWARNFALKRMAPDGAMIASCCVQDLTETLELQHQLAQARDAAEAAERRVRDVTNSLPGMVFEVRVDVPRRKTSLVYVTEGISKVYGLSREEALADYARVVAMSPPEDRDLVARVMFHLSQSDSTEVTVTDYRITRADGEQRWLRTHARRRDGNSGESRLVGHTVDVTAEKQVEQELQQARDMAEAAERRVRDITESLPGMVYEVQVDLREGRSRVVYVTDGVTDLYGLSREEAMADNQRMAAMMPPEDRNRVAQDFVRSMQSTDASVTDYRVQRTDGEMRWLRSHSRRRDVEGGIARWVGHTVDVTTEKRVEQELAQAKRAAEDANRAKSEFLANISHEIRTPMNAVLSFAYLGLRTAAPDRQREYFARIETAARSLLDIINDVLDLSKVEAGKLELDRVPFSIGQVLDNLESVVGLRAQEKGLGFRIEIAEDVPRALMGDPLRLGQVLLNLGGNAVKFTERGDVAVSVGRDAADALRFEIRDTGIGLTPEQIGRLFAPFTQADTSTTRRFGGTGLGLSICKRLVEMMGGDIEVESKPGQGSVFRFSIALDAADEAALPRAQNASEIADLAGLTVLVVDDHEANLEIARDLLQSAGVLVQVAASGPQAIAATASQRFDAVFMDMRMPGMDGIDATRRIRAAESETRVPIIALTANVMAPDRERCLAAGMDDFVGKPIDVDELFAALARVSGRGHGAPLRPMAAEPAASAEPDHDYERARAKVARAPNLYETMVRHFLGDPDLLDRLRAQVDAGQRDDAAITAHTLKGSAAQIGALRVARLAARLEAVLATRLPADAELIELDAALTDARVEMVALLPAGRTAAPDPARVATLHAQLEQELEDDEDAAWDTFEALSAALPEASRPTFQPLGALIANLDYAEALMLLRTLRG